MLHCLLITYLIMFAVFTDTGDDWLNEKTGWEESRLGEKKEERILLIFLYLCLL